MTSRVLAWSSLFLLSLASACSNSSEGDSGDGNGVGGTGSTSNGGAAVLPTGSGGAPSLGTGTGASNSGGAGSVGTAACAAQTAKAERRPVVLAFAFDVSGSMGKLDKLWHDPELKWKPVVAATEAFFADPTSVGISASLTFFPAADSDTKCDAVTYNTPHVPVTGLPSTAFADAITAVTPATSDDWRGGTPTLAVMQGIFNQLTQVATDNPDSNIAVVLVTDGYPQGCDDNAIASVEAEVAAHAGISTYVIGVENPKIDGAPETVANLNSVAVAGGTGSAFLIQTGDPTATSAQFAAVVETIRGKSISCELSIPAPPSGETLDKSKVNVNYSSGDVKTPFVYDPTCAVANAWHYDNEATPTSVVLCPNDCTTVMADPAANVVIEFGCEQRTGPIT